MSALEAAQQMLNAYLQAEQAILLGKETRIGGVGLDRWLRLEDLDMVKAGRAEWERKVQRLSTAAAGTPMFGGARFSVADVRGGNW